MRTLKYLIGLFIVWSIAIGIYYGIGVFLSNQWNILLWPVYGKVIFLIFVIPTLGKTIDYDR